MNAILSIFWSQAYYWHYASNGTPWKHVFYSRLGSCDKGALKLLYSSFYFIHWEKIWWRLTAGELSIGDMKSLHDDYEHLGSCYYPHHRHNCNHFPKNTSYGAVLYDIYILTGHVIIYEQCYLCHKRLTMTEGQKLSGEEVWRNFQYISLYFLSVN